MRNSVARANPLIGLTAEEYEDFACALVSFVALHATVDQTTYFMDLCRDYTSEIAGKVAVANQVGRQLVRALARGGRPGPPDTLMRRVLKKSLSH